MPRGKLYYVRSPKGRSAHLARAVTDYNRALCGRLIKPGWRWARSQEAINQAAMMHICGSCRRKAQ